MYDLKNIEVKGNFGEKYRGKIQEVSDDYIKIIYEDGGDIVCSVPMEEVFNAPFPIQSCQMSNLPELMPGTLVDVLIPSDKLPYYNGHLGSNEPKAWWPAIVKKRQGDLIVVDLLDLSNSMTSELNPNKISVLKSEIVEIDLARFRTENASFSKQPILSFKVDIPENLRKCFVDEKYETELRRWCGEPVSFTKASDCSYILVMSTESVPIHKAKLISKRWVQQWSDKYELTKQLEETRNQMQPIFEDEFLVHQKLVGFALGANYGYLKMVSQLPDVVSAQMIDNSGKFSVVAKTENAMRLAREKLDIKEEVVEFDRKLLGILLSDNYYFFSEIVKWAGLFRIMIIGDDVDERLSTIDLASRYKECGQDSDEIVLVSLTGTQNAIEIGREILEFAALNLENLIFLRSEMAEIDNELLNDIRAHQGRKPGKNDRARGTTEYVASENGGDIYHSNGGASNTHGRQQPPPRSAWKNLNG